MRMPVLVVTMSVISFSVGIAHAQNKPAPEPIFTTTPPVADRIVAEDEYHFTVRNYSPPVEVKLVRRQDASYDSPEMAAIAGISAMVAGDFDWFRSTWDKASLAVLEARDKAMNQDQDFWVRTWERAFRNRQVQLTSRIETGEYVLIAYRLVAQLRAADDKAEGDIELVTVLKADNGRWLATQDLSQDPVLAYWKTPDVRPKRMIRSVPRN